MSDSVGKISLDLELRSDLNKQINNVASAIGNNLKKTMESSTKSTLSGIKESVSNGVKSLNNSLKNSLNNTKKVLSNILKSFSKSKINIPIDNTISPTSKVSPEAKTKRGPPNVGTNIEELKATISNKEALLDNVNNKIEFLQNKLAKLRQQFNSTFNEERKMKIQEQILKVEGDIVSLTGKSDKLGFELADLDKKLKEVGNESVETAGKINSLKNNTNSAEKATKKLSDSTNNSRKSFGAYNNGIANSLKMMFKWMIILPAVAKGVKYLATGLMNNLKTNEQFSNSLAQIKSNLMIAFTPIYSAILPSINTLMSALSVATQYIASFISSIFGKTYNQSKQATQSLIDAKNAMGVYGDTAAKTAKKIGALAGFDEINNIADNNGGASSSVPILVTPEIDTSIVDSKMKAFVDKIKSYFKTFDFSNLSKAFNRLKDAITPTINTIGEAIKWLLVNILDPLAKWTISNLLPAFFNVLAGAIDFINPILEVFLELVGWLWEVFLEPIASWTGGVIVDVLNGIANALSAIGNWMNEHKAVVEAFIIVIGSFAAAWGLVTVALNAWNVAVGIWNAICAISTIATTAFGAAVAFLTNPITLTIVAIGALIAIGVLLYKHWDWLANVFATDWSKRFGFLGDILNGFLANARNIFNSVKQIFSGIIDFIAGVFTGNWSRAWQGVKSIFSGIMSGLGAVMKAPLNAVISLINSAIGGLNKISVNIPSWVPVFGGRHFGLSLPKIPYLAKGGIIDSPTLAMVGERGKEAVMPLENNTGWITELAYKIADILKGSSSDSGSSAKDAAIEIILKLGDTTFARAVIDSINKLQRQAGRTLIEI